MKGNTVLLYAAKYGWTDLLEAWLDKVKVGNMIDERGPYLSIDHAGRSQLCASV